MKLAALNVFILLFSVCALAQSDLDTLLTTEKSFEQSAAADGSKSAFLKFLSDDSIIFRPDAVNGKQFWRDHDETTPVSVSRRVLDYDVSSNGALGYTTGDWKAVPKGKTDDYATFGQYVTVWEKRQGRYLATIDIGIINDKLAFAETNRKKPKAKLADPNIGGWNVADASMNFLNASMEKSGLAGAYKEFATDDVRFLMDREPPILGKKKTLQAVRQYTSLTYPKRVGLLQAGDMAYTWNPCQFANSSEGTESGNCLQIWKFSEKKWEIVLSVFARIANEKKPELQVKQKTGKNK